MIVILMMDVMRSLAFPDYQTFRKTVLNYLNETFNRDFLLYNFLIGQFLYMRSHNPLMQHFFVDPSFFSLCET